MSRPDEAFVGDGVRVFGRFGVGGHGAPGQGSGTGARIFTLTEAGDETFTLLDLGFAGFFGGKASRSCIGIRGGEISIVEIDAIVCA